MMPANQQNMQFAGDLILQLMMTHRSLHHLFNQFLNNAELAQHYQLLFVLTRMKGIATQADLIKYLKAGESTTRASINVLAKKGYVTREKHSKHKRTQIIKLTKKAMITMQSLQNALRDVELVAFRNLNEDRLFHLWTTLIQINENVGMAADEL